MDHDFGQAPEQEIKRRLDRRSTFLRSLPKWVGRLLVLISLWFIGSKFWLYRQTVGDQLLRPPILVSVLLFSIVYAGSGLLLARGWWLILRSREAWENALDWKSGWVIYGKTQIAKYIPGNIFHFAGRHLLARQSGATHSQLVVAAGGEIVGTLLAAGLYGLLALPILLERTPHQWVETLFACSLTLFLIALWIAWLSPLKNRIRSLRIGRLFLAEICYLLFFGVSISLFISLCSLVTALKPDWLLVAGGYAVAWAIGFMVPGAPGGLGIREAVLVFLLSSQFQEKTILLVAILFRVITTLGDFLFFSAASATRAD